MKCLRAVQGFCFIVFIGLTAGVFYGLPIKFFLQMDPSLLLTCLSTRHIIWGFWPGLSILALTIVLGRFFCSTLCPMGTTIDIADRIIRKKEFKQNPFILLKYHIFFLIFGAAFLGVSFVFLLSPLSLITRFYSLIIYPILCLAGDKILETAAALDLPGFAYAQISTPKFALQWLTVIIFLGIFICARNAPRFWCRYICPAGAMFALCASKPLIRRQVSDDCVECGKCQRQCPMNAISLDNPLETNYSECIVCQTCVNICPTQAVSFKFSKNKSLKKFSKNRRDLILSTISGAGAALVSMTGINYRESHNAPGQIFHPSLIRPPGSLPEKEFLNRCVGCGACMNVCPTNTLQPVGLEAGILGFFSPKLMPRRGPCDPHCNECGQVCPTGAISPLSKQEKIWAKLGTAQVLRHKCLAWEFDRKCLVCDEVCPYNAIDFKNVPGLSVAVPFVNENQCSGCGFCQHHCPVQAQAAIIVEPMEALRLTQGSYEQTAKAVGLDIRLSSHLKKETFFDDEANSGLPPGFSE